MILRRGTDVLLFRQVRQEFPYFRITHIAGMPFAVINHIPPDPSDIGLFGAWTIMPKTDVASDAIQQLL